MVEGTLLRGPRRLTPAFLSQDSAQNKKNMSSSLCNRVSVAQTLNGKHMPLCDTYRPAPKLMTNKRSEKEWLEVFAHCAWYACHSFNSTRKM